MQRPGVRTHEPKSPILQDVRPLLPEEIRILPGEAGVMVVVCAGHGMSLGTRPLDWVVSSISQAVPLTFVQ